MFIRAIHPLQSSPYEYKVLQLYNVKLLQPLLLTDKNHKLRSLEVIHKHRPFQAQMTDAVDSTSNDFKTVTTSLKRVKEEECPTVVSPTHCHQNRLQQVAITDALNK